MFVVSNVARQDKLVFLQQLKGVPIKTEPVGDYWVGVVASLSRFVPPDSAGSAGVIQ